MDHQKISSIDFQLDLNPDYSLAMSLILFSVLEEKALIPIILWQKALLFWKLT